MFDLDKWQEIFSTIRKNKLRTFLTALGVFWGIFMLVFLMGSGKGLENGVLSMFGGRAINSIYVWTQRTALPYQGKPPGRRARLTSTDITAIKDRFDDKISHIAPRMHLDGGEIYRKDKRAAFDVRGEQPDILHIEAISLREGRFINELDLRQRRKVAVIGQQVKQSLFEKGEEAIGEYITIRGNEYMVAGVFGSNRKGENAADDERSIYIPLTVAQQITNRPNRIGWFVCAVKEGESSTEVDAGIKALLRERHGIAPNDEQGVRSFNLEQEFKQFQGLFLGISILVWIVGIGSLLAGIVGVGNIMLIVVKERTKEIGIRKAMGATPASIISMILLESAFITTLAGYLGLAAGTGIVALMGLAVGEGSEFFAQPEINVGVALGALAILIISGVLAGLLPAMHAASINPVEALKDE